MTIVVLVTGASRGLGAAIARCLSADGLTAAVNGVDRAEVEAYPGRCFRRSNGAR